MATAKSCATLGLYIATERKDGWFHVRAYPVTIGLTQSEMARIDRGDKGPTDVNSDTVRNCSDSYGERQNGLMLDGLSVNSQGTEDRGDRSLYAWEVRYKDVYAVDLPRAKAMYQTLASIDKRMNSYAAKHGAPVTYGQYLLQAGKAMGATKMIFPMKGTEKHSSSYKDQTLRFESLVDGVRAADYIVQKWKDEVGTVTVG